MNAIRRCWRARGCRGRRLKNMRSTALEQGSQLSPERHTSIPSRCTGMWRHPYVQGWIGWKRMSGPDRPWWVELLESVFVFGSQEIELNHTRTHEADSNPTSGSRFPWRWPGVWGAEAVLGVWRRPEDAGSSSLWGPNPWLSPPRAMKKSQKSRKSQKKMRKNEQDWKRKDRTRFWMKRLEDDLGLLTIPAVEAPSWRRWGEVQLRMRRGAGSGLRHVARAGNWGGDRRLIRGDQRRWSHEGEAWQLWCEEGASQRLEEEDRTWAPRDQGRFPPWGGKEPAAEATQAGQACPHTTNTAQEEAVERLRSLHLDMLHKHSRCTQRMACTWAY